MSISTRVFLDVRRAAEKLLERMSETQGLLSQNEIVMDSLSELQRHWIEKIRAEELVMQNTLVPVDLVATHIDEHSRILDLISLIHIEAMRHQHGSTTQLFQTLVNEIHAHIAIHNTTPWCQNDRVV